MNDDKRLDNMDYSSKEIAVPYYILYTLIFSSVAIALGLESLDVISSDFSEKFIQIVVFLGFLIEFCFGLRNGELSGGGGIIKRKNNPQLFILRLLISLIVAFIGLTLFIMG